MVGRAGVSRSGFARLGRGQAEAGGEVIVGGRPADAISKSTFVIVTAGTGAR